MTLNISGNQTMQYSNPTSNNQRNKSSLSSSSSPSFLIRQKTELREENHPLNHLSSKYSQQDQALAKEFIDSLQAQCDDRKMPRAHRKALHQMFMELDLNDKALNLIKNIEDLTDHLIIKFNAKHGTSYPLTDDLHISLSPQSTGESNWLKVLIGSVMISALIPRASAAQYEIQRSSKDALSPRYSNWMKVVDESLCTQKKNNFPCIYPADPTIFYNVVLLDKNTSLKPDTRYAYAYRVDGKTYIVPTNDNPDNVHHSHLASNGDGFALGEFTTNSQSEVDSAGYQSGHYLTAPTPGINRKTCTTFDRSHENPTKIFMNHLRASGMRISPHFRYVDLPPEFIEKGIKAALHVCKELLKNKQEF